MTEHNLFHEVQEDLERQKLAAFWKQYGPLIVGGAFAIVLATAGTNIYRSWQKEHHQKVTSAFMEAAKPIDDSSKYIENLQKFAAGNAGAAQADFALLRAGALAAQQGDSAKAVQMFDQLAHDAKAGMAFRQLGDLLSVEAQMDTGDAAKLMARLQPLTDQHAPWRYSAMEFQGYLALRTGDTVKARNIFSQLSQDNNAPQGISRRAADVLRSLN